MVQVSLIDRSQEINTHSKKKAKQELSFDDVVRKITEQAATVVKKKKITPATKKIFREEKTLDGEKVYYLALHYGVRYIQTVALSGCKDETEARAEAKKFLAGFSKEVKDPGLREKIQEALEIRKKANLEAARKRDLKKEGKAAPVAVNAPAPVAAAASVASRMGASSAGKKIIPPISRRGR